MLYLGNASSDPIRAAMAAGRIGCMITPAERKMPPLGAQWAADNGKFGKGYPGDEGFLRWLGRPAYCVGLLLVGVISAIAGS